MARGAQPAWALLGVASACGSLDGPPSERYVWDLPPGVPRPVVPAENEMSTAKVFLGRLLFYDHRLSGNGRQACASCHEQARAFAEARSVSIGSTGESHVRNSPGLGNVAYAGTLTWANPILTRLEQQNPIPLFGEDPIELGVIGRELEVLARLSADPVYRDAFSSAFPNDSEPIRFENVVYALASFQRSLISLGSPYDRFTRGEDSRALSPAALRGMELFFSERLECFHCHGGFLFSDSVAHEATALPERPFFNTGLYNLDPNGAYPTRNTGLFDITGRPEDMGKFRPPSLRNVAVTGPYMHDGSVQTLAEVVDIYARGGRRIEAGAFAGDGAQNPLKSGFVNGFDITSPEKSDLIEFLKSLTDPAFLSDARYSNPWDEAGR